ncbi:hypothetical protein ACSVH5_10895 [Flavobacterium sp. RSSA_27]|uniref:hypothetical protein n=1 Tax=Flavobacterium sp. RSSA_27 TaxID=3447667 RepID=UPI003F3C374A
MKKLITHILLFCSCFLILDACYYFVLQKIPAKQPDRRLEQLIKGEIQADVLILGSSRAAHNILAEDLSNLTKQKAFNLGFRGTSVDFHLQLLQWYLAHNAVPKTIIYTADVPFMFDRDVLKYRTDLLLPFVCYQEYCNVLIEKGALSKLALVLNFAKSNFNTVFVTPKVTIENYTTKLGSNPIPVELYKGNGEHFIADKNIVMDNKMIKAFKQLQDLCVQMHIELLVVIPPNNKPLNSNFIKILKKQCFESTLLYTYSSNFKTSKNHYFYDVSHLNVLGAKKFTNEIGNFILLKQKKS